MRRLLLATFIILCLAATGVAQTGDRIVIVHTGDIHGQILPKDGAGGMAELATILKRSAPDLVLDAGDMFTGTMLSDEPQGKPTIEIMNRLHYAVAALGNHEFDYGVDAFRARAKEAQFPILSANVQGMDEIKPYAILSVRGVRIGVIGLTTEELTTTAHPKNLKNIKLTTLVNAMETTLPVVRRQSDFIIVMAHLTQDEQIRIAKSFPEVKLIIAGHPHQVRTTVVGGTTIVEAGSSSRFVGRLVIRLDGKVPESITEEAIPVRDVAPDPEIQAVIEPYRNAVGTRSAEKIGEATADLSRSESEESALNNLIADALRAATGTQIAIHNVGGIRAGISRGPITFGSIFDVLPFSNSVVTLKLTGAQLKRVLSRRVLAVSGIRVGWDITRPSGARLVWVTFSDGTPIEDDQTYSIATNDFVQAGGDGLLEFTQAADVADSERLLRETVAGYVRQNPVISAKTDGRVVINK